MTETPRLTRGKRIERAARDERLARALRENLRRRKEQDRARVPGPPASGGVVPPETAPGDEPSA